MLGAVTTRCLRKALEPAQEARGTPPNSDEQPTRAAQSEPTPTSQETGR